MEKPRSLLMAMAIFFLAAQFESFVSCDLARMDDARKRVGDYLTEKVASDSDLEANFAAAAEMLEELGQKKFYFPSDRMAVLRELLELKDSLNQPRCSYQGVEQFDYAIRDWSVHKRTAKLATALARRHSDSCLDEQANKIAAKMQTIEPETLARAIKFADLTIKYIRTILPKDSILDLARSKVRSTSNSHYLEELWDMIREEAKDDPKQDSDTLEAKSVCQSYVFEPCGHFYGLMWASFELWKKFIFRSTKDKLETYLETNTNYYRYLICENIRKVGNGPALVADINRMRAAQ